MKRSSVAALLVLSLAVVACRGHESVSTAPVFTNAPVILISVDTLRADHLPAYGYAGVATPNIDALRRDSTLFRNAFAPAPLTLPSHLTMLTGLLPAEHGVRDNGGFHFDARAHPTIPSILRGAGYATGATVSSHVLRGETGIADAFDFYQDSIEPPPGAKFRDYQRPGFITETLAEKWVDQRQGKPFFLLFHIYEPHVPYDPPEPFRGRYASNAYDGEIATADAIVGALLEHLRRAGIYDRAIVIFASDHGEGLGDHGEEQHSVLIYRETIHVPLLVKLPRGAAHPAEITAPVSLADLLPTVTSLVGIPNHVKTSGLPLFGALPAVRPIYSESLYARFHYGWSELKALTTGARQFIDSARPELYDLAKDPAERHDLAPSSRREIAALRAELARFPSAEPVPSAVDPAEKAKLLALGYLSGSAGAPPSPVNPADRIAEIEELQNAARIAARGDLAAARAAFHAFLGKNRGMVEGWVQFGDALSRKGAFAEAAEAYRNALSRSVLPSGDLLLSLGNAYLQSGDLTRAAECGEAARAAHPQAARVLLGEIAMRRGDLAAAAREVSAISRPTASTLVLAAEIEQRQGHYDRTFALLDQAQEASRAGGEEAVFRLEYLRADTCARLNRLDDAAASFEKEIAAFPDELAAYARLALVRAVAGDGAGAARVLERMLRANPTPEAKRVAAETRRALMR